LASAVTRLDRYLLRECLPALLFSLLLYSGLAVTSANFPRLQWIIGTPLWGMLGWLALQLPTAVVQTLPIALLLAVLLSFGRLAAANELLAVQAGGVALRRLSAPMLALGLLAAGFALAMNQWVLPRANVRVGALWWELTSGGSGLFRLERQSIPLGDFSLSFAATDRRTDDLFGVRLEAWRGRQLSVVLAERARFVEGGLELYGYQNAVLDVGSLRDGAGTPEVQLQALVRLHNRAPSPDAPLTITFAEDVDELITRFSGGGFEDTRSVTRTFQDANDPRLSAAERRAAAVLFHRRLAEPFANLTLLAVALPLAILHARSRSVAFGLSLAVTLAWYLLLTLGQLLAQAGVVPVWLGLWFGNALLLLVGFYLLYSRTNLR
jgi:lipopolysaccharide export system permease protein